MAEEELREALQLAHERLEELANQQEVTDLFPQIERLEREVAVLREENGQLTRAAGVAEVETDDGSLCGGGRDERVLLLEEQVSLLRSDIDSFREREARALAAKDDALNQAQQKDKQLQEVLVSLRKNTAAAHHKSTKREEELAAKLQKAEDELDDRSQLQEAVEALQTRLYTVQAELQEAISSAQHSAAEGQLRLEQLSEREAATAERLRVMEEENAEKTQALQQEMEVRWELEAKLQAAEDEKLQIETACRKSENSVTQHATKLAEKTEVLQHDLKQAVADNAALTKVQMQLQAKLEAAEAEYQCEAAIRRKFEVSTAELEQSLERLQHNLKQVLANKLTLEKAQSELEAKLRTLEEKNQQIEAFSRKSDASASQLAAQLSDKVEMLQYDLQQSVSDNETLIRARLELQTKLEASEAKNWQIAATCKKSETTATELEQKLEALQCNLKQEVANNVALGEVHLELEARLRVMEEEKQSETARRKSDISALRHTTILEEKVRSLECDLQQATTRNAAICETQTSLELKLQAMREEKQRAEAARRRFEACTSHHTAELEEKVDTLQRDLKLSATENAALKDKLRRRKSSDISTRQYAGELEAKERDLQQERKAHARTAAERDEAAAGRNKLAAALRSQAGEIKQLRTECSTLRAQAKVAHPDSTSKQLEDLKMANAVLKEMVRSANINTRIALAKQRKGPRKAAESTLHNPTQASVMFSGARRQQHPHNESPELPFPSRGS